MRRLIWLVPVAGVLLIAGVWFWRCGRPSPEERARAADPPEETDWLPGKTQPAPGRSASIAPTVLHPVVEVLVRPGERVKKDQPLVRLDPDEPLADLAAKKAALAQARAALARLRVEPRQEEIAEAQALLQAAELVHAEAQRHLARVQPAWEHGVLPEQRYHEARLQLERAQAEERAAAARLRKLRQRPYAQELAEAEAKVAEAEANVKVAEAELEHYTVVAGISGVVTWLNVNVGTVARPGTTCWGEILDVSELDVRCLVSPTLAPRLRRQQSAEVRLGPELPVLRGYVVFISPAAEPQTGKIPVFLRLSNRQEQLPCYADVQVRFLFGS
jgi:membrane fusion protein (multidrug efflux system)